MAKNGRLSTPFCDPKGRYFVRRRVPKDLRTLFKGEFVQKSLGTRDPAEAAKRFPPLNAQIEADFELRRQGLAGWSIAEAEQPTLFKQLIERWIKAMDDMELLLLRGALTLSLPYHTHPESRVTGWRADHRSALSKAVVAGAIDQHGLGEAPVSIEESLHYYVDSHLGKIVALILPPSNHSAIEARIHTPDARELDLTITLSGLQMAWSRARKPSKSTYDELARAIEEFVLIYGNIPAAEVTKADLLDFKARLLKQPRSMPRSSRRLPLDERAKLPGPRVNPVTVGKKLALLKALLAYAFGEDILPQNAGSRIEAGPSHKTGKRAQFLPDEITAIFKLPLFEPSRWRYHRTVSDVTLAWLMLIGLTNGPRQKEAGQAELPDIVSTGSIMAIRLTGETDEDHEIDENATPKDRKSIKTEESERFLVIHPILTKLGFNSFIEALRRAGATRLFPDLWQSGWPSTHDASRYLNLIIDDVTTRRKVCYHSLRHTWLAVAENTDMKERTMRQLSGHAPRDESEKYGEAYLPTLALNAAKLQFDMVDWAPIITAWSTINWDEVVTSLLLRYPEKVQMAA